MTKLPRNSFTLGLAASVALLGLAALPGCSGKGDSGVTIFAPVTAAHASAPASAVVVQGSLMVYLASEALSGAGGTNFNPNDGDFADDCAVVVNMLSGVETDLNVATIAASIVGDEVYLVVSEAADNTDWSVPPNGIAGNVLLHFSSTSPLSFVDEIAAGANSWAAAGGRLYYVRGGASGLVNGNSTLAYLATTAPTTPVTVLQDDPTNVLDVRILAVDEDLVFLTADENVEGKVLNNDTDSTDAFVLALLNGKDIGGVIQNVGLAVKDLSTPVRARVSGVGDWRVAFLVDELATLPNSPFGLNDPASNGFSNAWKPDSPGTGCQPYVDIDTADQVLHVLSYALWSAAPLVNPPVNTGLAGTDRVLCTATAVATLVNEADDGNCDLNNDGDRLDQVLRWTLFAAPQLPFGHAAELNAVQNLNNGGTHGISDLAGRWICVVDERGGMTSGDNTDHDLDGLKNHDLVAWLNPDLGASASWVFDHNGGGTGGFVGATAMSDRPERDRLLVAFDEAVFGASVNFDGDSDFLDSSPTFARFDPSNANDLDFPGPAVAVDRTNPGIVLANGFGVYRVSEVDDNRDWNGDGIKNDFVFFRTSLSNNSSALIGSGVRATGNNLAGPSAIIAGTIGGAYLADEAMANFDLNGDGVVSGYAVTWFRIGS